MVMKNKVAIITKSSGGIDTKTVGFNRRCEILYLSLQYP